jgi:A/G-specific adenine glycosylase
MNIQKLEQWYLNHHRKLPFRESRDPYQIWVSEIMLQQTQMDTVIPYFKRFMQTYPTIESLAKTDQESLYKQIQGMGYYRRFNNMLKAAKVIVSDHQGIFPSNHKQLLKLPGIGEYTAGAIMSIAYNQPYHATDGNVIRVLSRVYLINDDMRIEKHKKQIKLLNQALVEKSSPYIYTQAIMELGALICKPSQPLCEKCPISSDCLAYQNKVTDNYPFISKAKKKKTVQYQVFVFEDRDMVYIRKRDQALLGGMYEFPQYEKDTKLPFDYKKIETLKPVKHVFTHLIWQMDVYRVELLSPKQKDWLKIKKADLKDYPMANAHKKIANQI